MTADGWLAAIVRREGAVTLTGLAAVTGLAWLYLWRLGHGLAGMAEMGGAGMTGMPAWSAGEAALAAAMWAAMMAAMMLPSAAPMILLFATINARRRQDGQPPYVSTAVFALAYLVVWGAFSLVAAGTQWGLQSAALLDPALRASPAAGGVVLLAAGVYQLTPLKYACLARCRSPLGFILSEWRAGDRGAFVMGARHGLYCLGCCWILMGLLFVGGVMNLAWVAAISVFVLAEKILPGGRIVSWASGLALLAWGAWTLGQAL